MTTTATTIVATNKVSFLISNANPAAIPTVIATMIATTSQVPFSR